MRLERILLTAFEPFGPHPVNSSWIAIEPLEGQTIHGARLKAVSLPVDRDSSLRLLCEAADAFKPEAVVSLGMLREGSAWRVEILARNRRGGAAAPWGSGGEGPGNQLIDPDGPKFLPTGLPAARIRGRLVDAGLEAVFSEDAGDFVCNHLFFRMMQLAEEGALPPLSGFVHVPPPKRAEDGSIENETDLQEGARAVVEALAAPRI